jgi:hypothetical protein
MIYHSDYEDVDETNLNPYQKNPFQRKCFWKQRKTKETSLFSCLKYGLTWLGWSDFRQKENWNETRTINRFWIKTFLNKYEISLIQCLMSNLCRI